MKQLECVKYKEVSSGDTILVKNEEGFFEPKKVETVEYSSRTFDLFISFEDCDCIRVKTESFCELVVGDSIDETLEY